MLSHAPLPEVNTCLFATNLQTVDHVSSLAISDNHVQQIILASVDDPILQVLHETIVDGWPEHKHKLPGCIQAYYDFQDELTVQDQLVFKGQCLVIPASLRRKLIMTSVHHPTLERMGALEEPEIHYTGPECQLTSKSTYQYVTFA